MAKPTDVLVDSSMYHMPVADRFFQYSEAYLSSAIVVNDSLCDGSRELNWPAAAVPLLLAAHAVELFFKGAISAQTPDAVPGHHDIEKLRQRFEQLYADPAFHVSVPFRIAQEMRDRLGYSPPLASIRYRYPVDKDGSAYLGLQGMMPAGFVSILSDLRRNFTRVQALIKAGHGANLSAAP